MRASRAADRAAWLAERQGSGFPVLVALEADGTVLGQKVTPLDRAGIYVPGGKAAYPSSVLMNAIPAHVAGVREIVMVVPTPDGVLNDLVLAAAHRNHDTSDNTDGNLAALCQRWHMLHDRPEHRRRRW